MKRKFVFPIFNGLIGILFGSLIGYYIFKPLAGILYGFLVGFLTGLGVELLLDQLGNDHWLYRRRVLLAVLLEIPLATFLLGPYAYVVAGARANLHPVCCETPLDFGAATYEEVLIEAGDGITMAGWFVPPEQTPGPTIVLLHGAGRDRLGTKWHASELIQVGYGVLLYDQRALGESTGDRVYMGWKEGYDLLQVLDYLETRPEVDSSRIGVVGLSGGAHIAINAVYYQPDGIQAMWLDGIQAQRIKDFPAPASFGERFARVVNAMILKMSEFHFKMKAPPAFVDILGEIDQVRMVFVAGGLNDFEKRVNQGYAGITGDNAEFWLIEDAWHLGGYQTHPEEYRRRMLDFFNNALK